MLKKQDTDLEKEIPTEPTAQIAFKKGRDYGSFSVISP
jgi:hypothetical protein